MDEPVPDDDHRTVDEHRTVDDPSPDPAAVDRHAGDAHAYPFGESFEDLDGLEHLAEQEGIGGLKVAAELIEDELRAKSVTRRLVELAVSLGITAFIFVRLIPQFFDLEYADVWTRLSTINPGLLLFLVAFWMFTMWCYAGVLAATLPHLLRVQAMVLNFSGSALANIVPFGGAAGVGATYAQAMSWGFDAPSITLSIIVTGVWNVFAKLGMPILVLVALVITGESTKGLGIAAFVGFAILVAAVTGLALVFKSEGLARSVGGGLQRTMNVGRRLLRRPATDRLTTRVMEFRHRTVGLVRSRWLRITVWMVLYKTSQALLSLLCARAVGLDGVTSIQIFAVYTFGELLSTIPFTPSGVGFVEAGSAQLLVTFGASADAAVAAVALYRAFTYLFEIPLGGVGWLTWATRRSWRRPPGSRAAEPAS